MPVPRVLLRAAAAAVAIAATGAFVVPAAAEPRPERESVLSDPVPASYDAPLLITIDQLTPGEVPEKGPVTISGTIANRDVEMWTGISIYPFINADGCVGCPPPITTVDELAEAVDTDPEAVVGNRITDVSATIDELAPGAVQPYSVRVPRRLLPVSTPGVYWFGVHALGASESTPGDLVADGRARTFLPYVPRGRDGLRGEVDAAIVVPLRFPVRHRQNGRLSNPGAWEAAFDSTGALGGPLLFGAAAVGKPVTWLIDPAVADAARRWRRGNPPRDLGPKVAEPPGDEEASPSGDAKTDRDDETTTEQATTPVALAAGSWLDSLEIQLRGEEVLALPYGDPDMSATPERMPQLYPLARARVGDVLSSWGVEAEPVVASPGGYLDPSVIDDIDDDSTLLVTDRMFGAEDFPTGPPVVGEYGDHKLAATSYGAATGGPGPEPRLGPVAFRQRVLAEATVRLLTPARRPPLIVVVPRTIDSTSGATFWDGLDADWLNLTTVADATDRTATPVDPTTLTYPYTQETGEIPSAVFAEADQLIDAGTTLQNLLPEAEVTAAGVLDEALTGTSYSFRADPGRAVDRLARSRRWIERRLGRIGIDGPPAVTLASASGTFAVTITNDLDRSVVVRLTADSVGDQVTVDVGEPVVLAAESRTTIQLDAHSRGTGVHNVTLSVTDVDGTPLGSSVEVPIRSGQVSEVIWVIIGAGVGILFLAIALRLVRRIRGRRADRAPDKAAPDEAAPDEAAPDEAAPDEAAAGKGGA